MKRLLRTDSFARYSLDRLAARPWNQSSWLSEGGKLIPVEAQVVKPAEGLTVSYQLLSRFVASHLGFLCNFFIQSQMFSSNMSTFFWHSSTSPSHWLLVEAIQKRKKQLEIAFHSDGHLGSEALLPIRKVPLDLFCFSLPCSPSSASILSLQYSFLCLPSCVRATSSVLPSGTVTNWHAEFSTGTLNPRDQACRQSSFISSPFANCVCSSHSALGRFWHKGPISRISHLLPGCKKKTITVVIELKCIPKKLKW